LIDQSKRKQPTTHRPPKLKIAGGLARAQAELQARARARARARVRARARARARAELEAMPVRALLALLAARGVSTAGAAEKEDLVALALG
jgi:hypothetical protein